MKVSILSLFESLFLLIFIVSCFFYTGDYMQICGILLFYTIGRGFLLLILRTQNSLVVHTFNISFIIYGFYMLFTHMVCISDPNQTYFLHNDASDAFYFWTIYFTKYEWQELYTQVFKAYFFSSYPGAALWFVSLAKFAQILDIENIRFFLRLQSVFVGSCLISIMAKCFIELKLEIRWSIRQLLYFGLLSYLFMCSVIFSRDILVAFCYTYIGYLFLIPQCSHRILKLGILAIVAGLMRPMNGMFALAFMLIYIYWSYRKVYKYISILMVLGIIIICAAVLVDILTQSVESILFYQDRGKTVSEGLFMKLYSLPFPLNIIFVVTYSSLLPLPFTHYIDIGIDEGGGFIAFPTVFEPFYWSFILISSIIICYNLRNSGSKLTLLMIASFLYIIITESIESNIRRTFAVYPILTMIYTANQNQINETSKMIIKKFWWPVLFLVNIVAIIYLNV